MRIFFLLAAFLGGCLHPVVKMHCLAREGGGPPVCRCRNSAGRFTPCR